MDHNWDINSKEEYKIKSIAWKNTIRDLNNKRKEFDCMQSDPIDIQQETYELQINYFKKITDLLEKNHEDQKQIFMSLIKSELEKTNENLKNILLTLDKKEKDLR